MPRQRILTIPQSLRVAKLWFRLLTVVGGVVRWSFWTLDEALFRQICIEAGIQDLMDSTPPPVCQKSSQPEGYFKVYLQLLI